MTDNMFDPFGNMDDQNKDSQNTQPEENKPQETPANEGYQFGGEENKPNETKDYFGPGYFNQNQQTTYTKPSWESGNTMNPTPSNKGKGMEVASLVCGIVSIVLGCCSAYFGLVLGVLSIVFAIVYKKQSGKMAGMAIAGLIMGIISTVFSAGTIVFQMAFGSQIQDIIDQIYQEIENAANQQQNGGNINNSTSIITRLFKR